MNKLHFHLFATNWFILWCDQKYHRLHITSSWLHNTKLYVCIAIDVSCLYETGQDIREPVSQQWQLQMIHLGSFQSLLTHLLVNLLHFWFPTLETDCGVIFSIVKARMLATCYFSGTNQSSHLRAMEPLHCPYSIIWVFWKYKKKYKKNP